MSVWQIPWRGVMAREAFMMAGARWRRKRKVDVSSCREDAYSFGVRMKYTMAYETDSLKMDEQEKNTTEMILNLTLEIIHLLTGESYGPVKKSGKHRKSMQESHVSGGWSGTHTSSMPPTSCLLIHERNSEQKILELTNKIIELLTEEVPVRCQDVTVYFSMEEWEYIEAHKDLYQDIIMEKHQPLTSQDGTCRENSPERCPSPLHSQDCPEETHHVSDDPQEEDFIKIKVEDTDEEEDCQRYRDDISTDSSLGK
ncbi:gastrula zinc finger protein XlCGF53.1-like isoform X1 [Dendropsophus ebraccatus]|uniref:gastrula zinc finger protein XlCGF53.1-like isoform X1 n=2 Tax=Dendropsophus ebraccatus TaxID=150705 RepID=UPI0038322921